MKRRTMLLLPVLLLIFGQARAGGPAISSLPPLGRQIAFRSDRTGHEAVFVMEEDGSAPRNLTPRGGADPAWSPDGTFIAFSSDRAGNKDIYVMNADGTNQTNLTNHPADDFQPTWSPDGRTILFVSTRSGDEDLWIMAPDGSNVRPLTSSPESERHPEWSNDERFILFSSCAPEQIRAPDAGGCSEGPTGPHPEIYIMNADGSNVRRWTNTERSDHTAGWHPTLPLVAYHSHEGEPRGGKIFIADVNTDGDIISRRQITDTATFFGDEHPDWSADGQKIVFSSDRDRPADSSARIQFYRTPYNEIYTMNPDGSDITRLTRDTIYDCCPEWPPRPERIRNASFERDADADAIPDDWQGINLSTGDGRVNERRKVGEWAVQLNGDPTQDKRLIQILDLPGRAGQVLTVAAWSQSTGLSDTGTYRVAVRLFNTDGSQRTFDLAFPKNKSWRYLKQTITAPKDYTSIRVSLELSLQTGTAWFDSVALYAR